MHPTDGSAPRLRKCRQSPPGLWSRTTHIPFDPLIPVPMIVAVIQDMRRAAPTTADDIAVLALSAAGALPGRQA